MSEINENPTPIPTPNETEPKIELTPEQKKKEALINELIEVCAALSLMGQLGLYIETNKFKFVNLTATVIVLKFKQLKLRERQIELMKELILGE